MKSEYNIKLDNLSNGDISNPEELLRLINKEMTKVKHESFGKIKITSKTKKEKKLDQLQLEKMKPSTTEQKEFIDKDIAAVLTDIHKEKMVLHVDCTEHS